MSKPSHQIAMGENSVEIKNKKFKNDFQRLNISRSSSQQFAEWRELFGGSEEFSRNMFT